MTVIRTRECARRLQRRAAMPRRCTCDGLDFHGHDDGCPRIRLDRYENEPIPECDHCDTHKSINLWAIPCRVYCDACGMEITGLSLYRYGGPIPRKVYGP